MKKKKMIRMGLFVFLMSFLSCGIVTAAEQMSEEEHQQSEKKKILELATIELKKGDQIRRFGFRKYGGCGNHEESELEKVCNSNWPHNYSLSLKEVIEDNPSSNDMIMQHNYDEPQRALHLEYLFLTSLDGIGSLPHFKFLKNLFITHSKLQTIDPSFFTGCSYLNELDLSHNELKEINKEMFRGLVDLRILNLSFNKLKKIEEGQFAGLYPILIDLDLSFNRLESLDRKEIMSLIKRGFKLNLLGNSSIPTDEELYEKLNKECSAYSSYPCLDPHYVEEGSFSADDESSSGESDSLSKELSDSEEEEEEEEVQSPLSGGQGQCSVSLGQQSRSVMGRVLSFPVNHPLITAGTVSAVLVGAAIVSRDPARARRAANGVRNHCVIS